MQLTWPNDGPAKATPHRTAYDDDDDDALEFNIRSKFGC